MRHARLGVGRRRLRELEGCRQLDRSAAAGGGEGADQRHRPQPMLRMRVGQGTRQQCHIVPETHTSGPREDVVREGKPQAACGDEQPSNNPQSILPARDLHAREDPLESTKKGSDIRRCPEPSRAAVPSSTKEANRLGAGGGLPKVS